MPLIPSESQSFPDDFSRTICAARARNEAKLTAERLNARSKRTRVIAPPEKKQSPPPEPPEEKQKLTPEEPAIQRLPVRPLPPRAAIAFSALQKEVSPPAEPVQARQEPPAAPPPVKPMPARIVVVQPPAQPAPADPPRIKVRPRALNESLSNGNAGHQEPKEAPTPVRQLKPTRARMIAMTQLEAPMVEPAKPVEISPQPVETFENIWDEEDDPQQEAPLYLRVRRHRKLMRFVMAELVVLVVLIPCATLAISHYFRNPIFVILMNGLTIAAAIAGAVIPIAFFAISPTLPRTER